MRIEHVFAGMAVSDLDGALAWYEQLMGRPPDGVPNDNEAVWQLSEGAALYVVRDAGRAGSAILTLIVDDLDERVSALRQGGLEPDRTEAMEGVGEKATFADPEGNAITFAELVRG